MTETRDRAVVLPEQRTAETAVGRELAAQPDRPIRTHSSMQRGLGHVAESRMHQGRFGRMFRNLPPHLPGDEEIAAIAARMVEQDGGAPELDNPAIPAGFTYLGQFVDHDISFDPSPLQERTQDPDALTNFRTPRFDLDCLYGRGPIDEPYLYDRGNPGHLLIDRREDLLDLPRNAQETALIADPRNDENQFVSHLHLTMSLFHNAVMDRIHDLPDAVVRGPEDRFPEAQRLVRWHYQWVVVQDFLRRIVGGDMLDSVLAHEPLVPGGRPVQQPRLHFFRWRNQVFMPVEFSAAAYRMGHSMVRARYRLNSDVGPLPVFPSGPIGDAPPLEHFGGFRRLPQGWQIEWPRLFAVANHDHDRVQPSRIIDELIAPPLAELPPEVATGLAHLAERNITRGARLGLPSGQDMARAMGAEPLTDAELDLPRPGPAPLWYYVLREAAVQTGGERLGIVGGRLVAEVFVGLLAADPSSYLTRDPGWRPTLPAQTPGDFTMGDLISFTGFGLPTG